MSLTGILNTADAGLAAAQIQLSVLSGNVTNVNTPGYVTEVANQVSTSAGGVGTGVEISSIQLAVNNFLQTASQGANATAGSADALQQYYDQVQQLFGDPSASTTSTSSTSSTDFFSQISNAFASFSTLAQNPTSTSYQQESISDVQQVLSEASSIYSGIQQARGQADTQISSDVTQVNSILQQISSLNQQITSGNATGEDTAGAQNSQQELISQLSSLMNIQVGSQSGGGVTIRTGSGVLLAGQGGAATLQYTPATTVNGQTVFNPITVNPPGSVPVTLSSQDLTSGQISGLMQFRDVQAPQAAEQLGQLTSGIADQLNQVSNSYSAMPPPSSLTGQPIGLDLPSAISGFTGTTNIVITNSSGVVQHTLAINFSAGTMSLDGGATTSFTPNSFLTSLNSSLGGYATASFSNGQLSLSTPSGSGTGIAIADSTTAPSDNGGDGFSMYFGLNDLVTSSQVTNYQTGLTPASANEFSGGQVSFSLSTGSGGKTVNATVPIPSGGTMADVLAALNSSSTGLGNYGTFSLDSNGQLSFTASNSASTLSVTSDNTSWAGGPSLTQLFGVTPGVQADLTTSYAINPSILSNPGNLPLSAINLSAAAGTPAIAAGDGSGAQALADAANATMTFMPAGGNAGGASTISNYASNLAGAIGGQAQTNTSNQTQADSMQTTASNSLSSAEGVNLDQQLTNLQIYQQAYSASASLLQAEQAMFTALNTAVTSS
jgi:flagellar hook-associated protein 1